MTGLLEKSIFTFIGHLYMALMPRMADGEDTVATAPPHGQDKPKVNRHQTMASSLHTARQSDGQRQDKYRGNWLWMIDRSDHRSAAAGASRNPQDGDTVC